jgi:hypothetical protein
MKEFTMRTVRNLAFLALIATMVVSARARTVALALYPTPECQDGCSCGIDPNDDLHITFDCEEVAPVDECAYADTSAENYCSDYAMWYTLTHQYEDPLYCELGTFDGCSPAGLEPPTDIDAQCLCWR